MPTFRLPKNPTIIKEILEDKDCFCGHDVKVHALNFDFKRDTYKPPGSCLTHCDGQKGCECKLYQAAILA